MLSKIQSLGCRGVTGYAVSVECHVSNGLPGFDIVGLPDAAVKEARERVRSAIKTNGMKFPVSRLTVNLAPADTRKAGTLYDLPVLLGILCATGEIRQPPATAAFLGEVSLAGEVRPVTGALTMALAAEQIGLKELYVPAGNAAEAAFADLKHFVVLYGVVVIAVLLAAVVGTNLWLTRNLFAHIREPLAALMQGIHHIQNGDLNAPTAYTKNDEFRPDCDAVDEMAARLREKIEDTPSDPKLLQTVWGVGYRLHTV